MKKLLLALAMVVTLGVLGGGAVQATTNMQTGTDVRLGADETVDASYYAAGETVVIEGTVKGDLYCAGQNIEVNGTIEGDVLCAGQEVRIGGTVQGDVRAAGQNVLVHGEIAQSATLAGQMITIEGTIGRDMTATGQNVRIDGDIGRDLVAGAERAIILGSVGRNVEANIDTLALRDEARIDGNLSYTSFNEVDTAQGATVTGMTERHMPPETEAPAQEMPFAWLAGAVVVFFLLLPLAVVWLALMPRVAHRSAETMMGHTLLAIALGFVTLIVTPIIATFIMITVIGLPLGLILLALWLLAMPVAFIMAAYSFGVWLAQKAGWQFAGYEFVALILALAVVVFAASLPFIGWLIALLTLACGFGGIALMTGKFVGEQYKQTGGKTKKKA